MAKPMGARRTYKKRKVMGGPILPPLGAARAVVGGTLTPEGATLAGNSLLGSVAKPLTDKLRPSMRSMPAPPKDTSAAPIMLPKQDLYSHPAAKTAYPRNPNAKAKKTSKGLGRGGARPI